MCARCWQKWKAISYGAWQAFIMTDEPQSKIAKPNPSLSQEVGAKAARKLKARRKSAPGVWFGLGMMGLIGWSVAIPTVLGAA